MNDSVFDEANRLYDAGRYTEALMHYEQMIASYPRSSPLWYNAGNAEFRMGNYGKAIYRYRQALVYAPWDADIQHNLNATEKQLAHPPPKDTPMTIRTLLRDLFLFIPENILLTTFLVFWFVFFIALSLLRLNAKPKYIFKFLWTIFACLLLLSGLTISKFLWHANVKDAVILHAEVIVRAQADNQSPATLTLYEGRRTEIIKDNPDWLFIRTESGHEGWIRRDEAGVIYYD